MFAEDLLFKVFFTGFVCPVSNFKVMSSSFESVCEIMKMKTIATGPNFFAVMFRNVKKLNVRFDSNKKNRVSENRCVGNFFICVTLTCMI